MRVDGWGMGAHKRENALWGVLAVIGLATISWLGLGPFGWNDYVREALPSINALLEGHATSFFTLAPVYGGSLLERAPFAFAASMSGGSELTVYRMMALPCLLASGALGLWLVAHMRRTGQGRLASALALALCVGNPMALTALESGHPEELLGGALCVVAVLLGVCERPVWAGVALGLAVVNKQWAFLALGPVLLALPSRRSLCISVAGALAVSLLAPFALSAPGSYGASVRAAASPSSAIFLPSQLWWFLGRHLADGYRAAPDWVGPVSHPLIMMLGLPIPLAAWFRSRRKARKVKPVTVRVSTSRRESDALLTLALLLALRCVLDPWDTAYYPVPFILALVAWEALARRRAPVLALVVTIAVWMGQHWIAPFASPDVHAAFFVAWSVPLASGLMLILYAPGKAASMAEFARSSHRLGRPITFPWTPQPSPECSGPSSARS